MKMIVYIFVLVAFSSFYILVKSEFQVRKYLSEKSLWHVIIIYFIPIVGLFASYYFINFRSDSTLEKNIQKKKEIEDLSNDKIAEYLQPENCSLVLGDISLVLKNNKSSDKGQPASIVYYYKYIVGGEEFTNQFSVKSVEQIYYERNKLYIWHSTLKPSLHQIIFIENDPFPMSIQGLDGYVNYEFKLPEEIYEDLQNAMHSGH